MYRFLKTPHLPEGKVHSLAIGERYLPSLRPPLSRLGISVLGIPDNPRVDPRLAGHADLTLAHLGGGRFITVKHMAEPCGKIMVHIGRAGGEVLFAEREQGPLYPRDAGLNFCIAGRRLLYNPRTAEPMPPESPAFSPLPVHQGYTKCAVCLVNESSIITGDGGIAAAADNAGLEVLRISPGHVLLDGFDTGFMGGAAFLLSPGLMAFTGRLDGHPDRERIESFLRARRVAPLYLTDGPVFDIGSAVLLTEAQA
jgi:hypothetical protein